MQAVVKRTIVFSLLCGVTVAAYAAISAPAGLPTLPQNPAAAAQAIEEVNPIVLNQIPNLPAPETMTQAQAPGSESDAMMLAQAMPAAAPAPRAPTNVPPQPSIVPPGNVQMAPLPPLPGMPNQQPVAVQQQQPALPPQQPAPPPGSAQSLIFQDILKKQFPLSDEQIQALHRKYKNVQRAIEAPAYAPPKPTVSTKVVVLSPGSIPPVIRLASGYVSSVVFLDQTGSPWPLQAYDVGDPSAFNIQWDRVNILMIQGSRPYATGNMAIKLVGLPTPVMLTLVNDQKVVDYRIDLRVQGLGPNAKPALAGDSIPAEPNSLLLNLLQGVPPAGSQALTVTGGQAQAWLYGGKMLVRTPYTILSPDWSATMSSADGTKVYEMGRSPLILVADNGRIISLKVEGL